jgi:hypothetical protein
MFNRHQRRWNDTDGPSGALRLEAGTLSCPSKNFRVEGHGGPSLQSRIHCFGHRACLAVDALSAARASRPPWRNQARVVLGSAQALAKPLHSAQAARCRRGARQPLEVDQQLRRMLEAQRHRMACAAHLGVPRRGGCLGPDGQLEPPRLDGPAVLGCCAQVDLAAAVCGAGVDTALQAPGETDAQGVWVNAWRKAWASSAGTRPASSRLWAR